MHSKRNAAGVAANERKGAMGSQLQCECRWDDRVASGKAMLESDYLLFRGEFRLKLTFTELTEVVAGEGQLRLQSSQGKVCLKLGPAAAGWAQKILHPPGRWEKLGIKPGMRVVIRGGAVAEFVSEVAAAGGEIVDGRVKGVELIFHFAERTSDLKALSTLKRAIARNGAIWVVYPKGLKTITENGVMAAGRESGLVDVKVMRFSDRQTALKFVIPVKER